MEVRLRRQREWLRVLGQALDRQAPVRGRLLLVLVERLGRSRL